MEQMAMKKALEWANDPYFDLESRNEIKKLIDEGKKEEIIDRFYKDLEFGTGGLRSIIGIGSNRISIYTVRRATQALASMVLKYFSNEKDLKVAISYDSRRFSKEFAIEAAKVCAGNGIKSYIFDRLNPTPTLSFAVRELGAKAGIMVTASHNPPTYNGYKAYWNTGGQVVPPVDQEIIDSYNKITDFKTIKLMELEEGLKSGFISWLGKEMEDTYINRIKSHVIRKELCLEKGSTLSFCYTPLHGAGSVPCMRMMNEIGLVNGYVVPEQKEPDMTFRTVKYPNPEDPEALKLVVELMKEKNADLAFGSDPDADRIGVVVNQGKDKAPYFLNGNQVGVLLLDYILKSFSELNKLPKDGLVFKSIVTSEMQTAICNHFGVEIKNTLTGFKWMCGLYDEMIKKEKRPLLFASEESYGYLVNDEVRDKDAVSAMAMVGEMALYYKLQGKTLIDVLYDLYDHYGFYSEDLLSLSFEGKEGADKIVRIMNDFRNAPPKEFFGTNVTTHEDYLKGEFYDLKRNQKSKIDMYPSDVLGYALEDGSKIFLRPSGTEPKIKFYIMIREQEGNLDAKTKKAKERSLKIKDLIKERAMKA